MPHPGKSAAEAGPRPLCSCHGVDMRWNRRVDLRAGGFWRCRVGDTERFRKWKAANKAHVDAYMAVWRAKHPEHRRAYLHRWRYGLTKEEYARLLTVQGNRCAICDVSAEQSAKGRLHVDHDHSTGKVRGLLCNRCNSAVERVEIPGWTVKALAYLA